MFYFCAQISLKEKNLVEKVPTDLKKENLKKNYFCGLGKVLMQGKLIAVAYTLCTYWNQFSLGGICKQEYRVSHKTWHSIHSYFYLFIYKDLFTHKDINTYINGVVKII